MTAFIGQAIDRVDGRLKVTGQARYAAEFAVTDVVHATLVQSTVAAGTILSIDTGAASGMPGVLAVLTPDNAPRLQLKKGAPQAVLQPLLQDREILYNGQHVAVVVADTLDRAWAAAAAVRVTYRAEEAITVMDGALGQAYVPKQFRNGERSPDSNRGDPDGAFERAAFKLSATYTTPIEHHNPMEMHATIAQWQGDRLTVWTATQGITGAHRTLAAFFGLPEENVHVICPYVGGGFGSKGNTWPPATLAAMAARLVGRPVKLMLTRRQMFTSNGYRPRTVQKLRIGAERDGSLVALRHDGITQMSMAKLGEYSEPVALASEMMYACDNVAVTHRLVAVNAGLPTYMRAPGEAPGMFALESAMDEVAAQLGMDPIAFRLHNETATDMHENKPFSGRQLRACMSQGAEKFGWSARTPAPRSMRDGRFLVGMGFAVSTYPANRQPAEALVQLRADGRVVVASGTQDLGTGTYTVLSQVAADELGVPISRVHVLLGDSRLPQAPVSGGSTTVASVTPAVQAACQAARDELFRRALADPQIGGGVTLADLDFRDGMLVVRGRSVPIGQVLARAGMEHVEGHGSTTAGDGKKTHSLHSFGAQFAEVRVDPDLGEIRVSRFLGVFDAGRILNAKTAHSQFIGGITYGIGMALLEATHVDAESGRITNSNVSEYLMPVHADIPDIQTLVVASEDKLVDPLGARGIGELPMVGVAAAVANAVYHATGIRVRDLPIRIEDVLA